ncbi:hypothetical protein Bpfe_004016 [Biomphalaria pfeifferi]|uniref:Uncharacterized protein n=1 Tax=Biomphalaria pfeifferi TaxID=112525 RepID=A0AAD8C531_BIOPF|nr:hypothetical protein Bpfe_004016 [Biomphalaria pfeifferi]
MHARGLTSCPQLNLLTNTMKAAFALFLLAIAASVLADTEEDYLNEIYAGVDVRCLFDEVLCWDLHTVCLDKTDLRLKQKIQCDIDKQECIDGLPHDCRNMFPDAKGTTPKTIS